ncbi:MAG: AI-2E family transporter [Culicoidibacterales bacterium]
MLNFFEGKNQKILLSLILVFALIWLLTQISATIFPMLGIFFNGTAPFWMGLVIAFLLNPVIESLGNKVFRGNKTLAVVICFTILLLLLIFVIFPVVNDFSMNFPEILRSISKTLDSFLGLIGSFDDSFKAQLINQITMLGNTAATSVFLILGNSFSTSMSFFLTMIITIFFLLEYDKIRTKVTGLFGARRKLLISAYVEGLEKQMFAYLRSFLVNFLISTAVFGVALHFLGVDNAWSFSIIVSLLICLIPIIGPLIATVILAMITLPISGFLMVIGFFGLLSFMQIFLSIISPRIYANTLDIPNVLIMFSFLLGGTMFGIVGMLLAVPGLIVCMYTFHFLEKKYDWGGAE